jgi:response regulator RpfG family c-di-GMP phosphodiesterase
MSKIARTADLTVLKSLLDIGAITPDLYEGAMHKQEAYGGEIEEILLDSGAVDEKTLLNALANTLRTKFVHSSKLRQASFKESVLEIVPEKVVRRLQVFPIAWDVKRRVLSIITSRPQDLNLLQEVEKCTAAREVQTYLARPAAVRAAIERWYGGDENAFLKLDRQDTQAIQQMMDVYGTFLDEDDVAAPETGDDAGRPVTGGDVPAEDEAPAAQDEPPASEQHFSAADVLGTLHIMMGLMENDRGDLRGHSVQVSRSIKQVVERMRLGEDESVAMAIAGAIHDLGKFGLFHLTALNVAEWQGHWEAAASRFLVPSRLFEPVKLPRQAHLAVNHMYERMDGNGFPDGLKGKDIPLGARVLAIVDTFSDLTINPKNPYRRVLSAEEATRVLEKYKGTIFDPMLVDVHKALVAGDQLRESILAGQNHILVIDPDPEQAVILEINLASRGFNVEVVSNTKVGMEAVLNKKVDIVLTEVDLKPIDGFEFVKRVQANEKTRDIPVIFFTSRSDQSDVSRGFELGAVDYVVKPSSVDVLVAKVQRTLQAGVSRAAPSTATGGVSGSLSEMDLPDLVQVLSQGRKSGALRIQSERGPGDVFFQEGRIVHVTFAGQEGEQAFYELLHLDAGQFQVDPTAAPDRQTVQLSVESLLLEGMRLLDESNR